MKRKKHNWQKRRDIRMVGFHWILTSCIAISIGIATFITSYSKVLYEPDEYITNYLYTYNPFERADGRITLIAIDNATKEAYGEVSEWSRDLLADAVNTLSDEEASVIALDLNLSKDMDDSGDAALAKACATAGNVITLATANFDSKKDSDKVPGNHSNKQNEQKDQSSDSNSTSKDTSASSNATSNSDEAASSSTDNAATPVEDVSSSTDNATTSGEAASSSTDHATTSGEAASSSSDAVGNDDIFVPADSSMKWSEHNIITIDYPYDALADVTSVGVANAVQQSPDGSIHSAALQVQFQDNEIDSFAVSAYKRYQDYLDEDYVLPDLDAEELFGFNRIWNTSSYQIISFQDLLNGNYDAELLEESIALVGEYEEQKQTSYVDYMFNRFETQEILMEAGIIQALLTQRVIYDVDPLLQAAFYSILLIIFYYLLSTRKPVFSLLAYFLNVIFLTTFAYFLNAGGFRLLLLVPLLYILTSLFCFMLQHLMYTTVERIRMEKTLKLYMDSQIVDQITEVTPLELTRLSERRNIAVLFVDIRGFTSLSEELDPSDVVEILNQYFTIVYAAIQAWNGTLDKFIGDAAMAIFNAPNEQENYILHAVCAADDIQKGFAELKDKLYERFKRNIDIGIGINCGEAIVGNIGCLGRMDYTAIGDAVNTASRLESKAAPGQILISESVLSEIQEISTTTSVGALALKGKAKAVNTYQLDNIEKPKAPNAKARKEFLNETRLLYSKIGADFPISAILQRK